jgi:hypothetical protein
VILDAAEAHRLSAHTGQGTVYGDVTVFGRNVAAHASGSLVVTDCDGVHVALARRRVSGGVAQERVRRGN